MDESTTFTTADGTNLHVVTTGSGPDVVFQHGLCGDERQTREAFPEGTGFRRTTIEARGHGASEAGDPALFSLALFTADLAEYIERHLEPPVVVGGISMGAALAVRLAVERPDLVRALVIVRPAWVTEATPANMAPNALVGRLLGSTDQETARQQFLADDLTIELEKHAPDNMASLSGFFSREPKEVTAALLASISKDGPGITTTDLKAIQLPTLVIGHGLDSIHPLSHALELSRLIDGAVFTEITPKAKSRGDYVHDLHLAIRTFLEKL
jgi:pimeloyl-ACP methyl ester carboxylesterase